MTVPARLAIGTRASPLAMAQARETEARLAEALGLGAERLLLKPMTSTGDMIQNRPLAEAGGKGLFTKELDEALLAGAIDLAVHSAKDLPTVLPDGLAIAGYLPREDVRDALVTTLAADLAGLPDGASLGTASLRRGAIVRRARPDLRIVLLRGNVQTRLAKLSRGEVGATLLALAGLRRLGLEEVATRVLSVDEMLPAVGQGAIALVCRTGDEPVLRALSAVADPPTGTALAAERAYLSVLDGSCRTPIAGHGTVADGTVRLRGLVLRPDGTDAVCGEFSGPAEDADRIGRALGEELKSQLPPGFFAGG